MINLLENRYFDAPSPLYSTMTSFILDSTFSFLCEIQPKPSSETNGEMSENRIVGVVLAENGNKPLITTLCVEKEYSNLGIGRKLMTLCIQSFEEVFGKIEIELLVKKNNETARKLYESLGFEIVREVEKAYFDKTDGLIMVKNAR